MNKHVTVPFSKKSIAVGAELIRPMGVDVFRVATDNSTIQLRGLIKKALTPSDTVILRFPVGDAADVISALESSLKGGVKVLFNSYEGLSRSDKPQATGKTAVLTTGFAISESLADVGLINIQPINSLGNVSKTASFAIPKEDIPKVVEAIKQFK
jgi:hypothetical protein